MCCIQIWPIVDDKSVKSCVAYLAKKQNFAWLCSCHYCVDRAQNLPRPAPGNVLRVLQLVLIRGHSQRHVTADDVTS